MELLTHVGQDRVTVSGWNADKDREARSAVGTIPFNKFCGSSDGGSLISNNMAAIYISSTLIRSSRQSFKLWRAGRGVGFQAAPYQSPTT